MKTNRFKIKYFLTAFLILTTIFTYGQAKAKVGNLTKTWVQGKLDSNGNVIQADVTRAGWYNLTLEKNKNVVLGDAVSCGMGHAHYGTWSFNKKDKTLTFHFNKQVEYGNNRETKEVNETEIYNIKKSNSKELILEKQGQSTLLIYMRKDLVKE